MSFNSLCCVWSLIKIYWSLLKSVSVECNLSLLPCTQPSMIQTAVVRGTAVSLPYGCLRKWAPVTHDGPSVTWLLCFSAVLDLGSAASVSLSYWWNKSLFSSVFLSSSLSLYCSVSCSVSILAILLSGEGLPCPLCELASPTSTFASLFIIFTRTFTYQSSLSPVCLQLLPPCLVSDVNLPSQGTNLSFLGFLKIKCIEQLFS